MYFHRLYNYNSSLYYSRVVDAVCKSSVSDNIKEIEDRIIKYLRANSTSLRLEKR